MYNARNFLCCIFLISLCLSVFSFPVYAQQIQQSDAETYSRGINLFEEGLFSKSAELLEQFAVAHPDHQLRPSADFYRARALGRADSGNIISHYETFITEYPKHDFSRKLLFELAGNSEEELKFNQAITFYNRALDLGLTEEQSARAHYWIAENYVSMGENESAREKFLYLADTYPESEWAPKALYARGRLYLSENEFDASSDAFEILKDRYPNDDMTRRIGTALGESYYQQGRYEEAIEALRGAMPYLDGELESKAVFLIAESHNYLGNFDRASNYYKQYINLERGTDNERNAHYGLGWVYHKQEIYHWASESFGQAAAGDDELARKALYYKAVNEKIGGRYPDAIETFRSFGKKYEEGPWMEEGYYEWAVTAFEMGIYDEAIEALLSLVRSDQELEWAGEVYTLLGEAYFANKEYTRSIQAFEAAEEITDLDPSIKLQARFQKSWVLYRNQAYREAQEGFDSVYDDAPNTEIGKEALFWSADSYYNLENYGPASSRYAQFISEAPDHELVGAAHYALGWSYFKMGDYERAIDPLRTFLNEYEAPPIELYPYDTDTILRLGDAYYATGRYDEAVSTYEDAIGAEPGGDYAMFQIANSYYRDDNTYDAVTTFRRFLRIYPYSRLREQAQYNIAYIYLNSGNYTQAIEEFQTVINKYPNTSWAARSQYNIGDAYYNAGDYDEAIEAYNMVMENYPESDYIIEAVNGIQFAQLSSGREDSSSAVLEDFLNDHPQTSMADQLRYRQAETLMQTGDYERAIEEFRQYIRITNNQNLLPDAHFNLANAYEEIEQMDQAIQTYEYIVENFPDSERIAPSLRALGRISFEQQNYRQSADYYTRLLNEGQEFELEGHLGVGNAELALGNIDEAEEQFEAALDIDSDYDPARVGLGKVEISKENYTEARDLLNLVAEANSTEVGAEAQYLLGDIHQRQRDFNQALDAYSNVKVLYNAYDEWVAKAMLKSAESYIQLGNRGDARNELNSIIENYPDREEARRAQQLLESNS